MRSRDIRGRLNSILVLLVSAMATAQNTQEVRVIEVGWNTPETMRA